MSSLIDASETLGHEALTEDCDAGIIHFDATQRRKEKMRQKSQDAPAKEPQQQTPAPEPVPEPPPAAAPQPVEKRKEPAATLDGFNVNPPEPAQPAFSLKHLSGADLEKFLIDFVVEQTGYPPEMVEMDADLEADLGIDSIKKAQLFGELAEQFEVTVDVTDESLSLDDFPTLGHVMQFLESAGSQEREASGEPEASQERSVESREPEKPGSNGAVNPHANGNGAVHHPAPQTTETSVPATRPLGDLDLESFLVEFVVEQTGYPPEMVELDADLEADLGIDSIKKAQLFGELAEQFSISVDVADENLSLDDFPTLRHVMEFLQLASSASGAAKPETKTADPVPESIPQTLAPVPAAPATTTAAPPGPSANGTHHSAQPETEIKTQAGAPPALGQVELEEFLVNFVVEQTGYPPEMVELDADLEADLGIDSIKKAQMMGELAEQFSISVDVADENLSLDDFPTLRHVCEFLAAPGKAAG